LDGLRVFELLNDKIALARDDVAAQPGASHLPDMLRDPGFPLHEDVQIAGARFDLIYVRFARGQLADHSQMDGDVPLRPRWSGGQKGWIQCGC
jgi:hypothetical protein